MHVRSFVVGSVLLAACGGSASVQTSDDNASTSEAVTATVSYAQWSAQYALTGSATATPLNDGIPNLLKYFANIDPTVAVTAADRMALPQVGTVSSGDRYITLTYREGAATTGLSVQTQVSADLKVWKTVTPASNVVLGNDPVTGDPIHELKVSTSSAPKKFIRLVIVNSADSSTVSTVPQGLLATSIPAASSSATQPTLHLSLPFVHSAIYEGKVTAVTANGISVGGAPWAAGSFASGPQDGNAYFVTVLSGTQAGRTLQITANTTNALTLDTGDGTPESVALNTSGFSLKVGDVIQVFAGDTLASFFGDGAAHPLLVKGGATAATADVIGLYTPALNAYSSFYFDTTLGYWHQLTSTLNENTRFFASPYGQEITLTRAPNQAATTLYSFGRVAEVTLATHVASYEGTNRSALRYATDITLAELQLGANWVKGTSPIAADIVSIFDNRSGEFVAYYQRPDSTWRVVGDGNTDQSNVVIPAGTAVTLSNGASTSGVANFFRTPLPYSVNPAPIAPVTYAAWLAAHDAPAGSDPGSSAYSDGVPNALKYLYGMSPTLAYSYTNEKIALPAASASTIGSTKYFLLTYPESTTQTGLTVNVQISSDLTTWTTVVPKINTIVATSGSINYREVGVDESGATTKYIRLDVVDGTTTVTTAPGSLACQAIPFSGGDGSGANPYQICSPAELDQVRNYPTANFTLTSNIELARVPFHTLPVFSGGFDGQNFQIQDWTYEGDATDGGATAYYAVAPGFFGGITGVGLFSALGGALYNEDFGGQGVTTGGIANVNLVDATVVSTSTGAVGALVGVMSGGSITHSTVNGGKVSGGAYTGGLVGYVSTGTVAQVSASLSVSGAVAGGLIGTDGTSIMSPTGTTQFTVTNSYAGSTVSGTALAGGLIGEMTRSGSFGVRAYLDNVYTRGSLTVEAGGSSDGIVPLASGEACSPSSAYTDLAATACGEVISKAALFSESTFVGWDFTNVWEMGTSGPQLR